MPVSPPNNTNRSARESYAIAAFVRPVGPPDRVRFVQRFAMGSYAHVSPKIVPAWSLPPNRTTEWARASSAHA